MDKIHDWLHILFSWFRGLFRRREDEIRVDGVFEKCSNCGNDTDDKIQIIYTYLETEMPPVTKTGNAYFCRHCGVAMTEEGRVKNASESV